MSNGSLPPDSTHRVVRKRLADGSVKEYLYPRTKAPKQPRRAANSVDALLGAYERSPEWNGLKPRSQKTYRTYLKVFHEDRDEAVTIYTRKLLLEMRDAIAATRGHGAANGFINTACALFAWAVDREWLPASPAAGIKRLKGGHLPAWSEDELVTALRLLEEPYRRIVVLAVYTGQRRIDLCSLRRSNYDGRKIRLTQQKTGVKLAIPVHSALRRELMRWERGEGDDPPLLAPPRAAQWQPEHMSDEMRRVLDDCNLPGLNVHGLRKLAAVRLAEAGCSVHELMAILGWKTLAMAQLYTQSVEQEALAEAAIVRLETRRVKPRETAVQAIEDEDNSF